MKQTAPLLLAALVALACGARAQVVVPETATGDATGGGTPGTYDPCLPPPTGVQQGDSFVFGLAFWPGSTVADWGAPYNATSGAAGLNPCIQNGSVVGVDGTEFGNYQDYLNSKGVVWGTYMIKVDTIAGLRSTRAEMDQIWKNVVKTAVPEKQAITMIAFRGQNRSEAQYVVSGSTAASEGTGVVQQLSLIVAWDRGSFNGFTWYNQGPCDSCGGLTSATCVQTQYEPSVQKYPQSSCAWSLADCDCPDALARNMLCPANNCTSVVYVGHRGSDKGGRTMNSGYQIEQINKYSFTSFFWKLLDGAFNLIGNTGIGTPGSGTTQATAAETAAAEAAAALAGTDAALAQQQGAGTTA